MLLQGSRVSRSKSVPPDAAAAARRLYLEGVPVSAIVAQTGLTIGAVYHWIDREISPEGARLKPAPRRKGLPLSSTPLSSTTLSSTTLALLNKGEAETVVSQADLVARLWRTADWQARDIEARLTRFPFSETGTGSVGSEENRDAERAARALATLARTVRELAALGEEAKAVNGTKTAKTARKTPKTASPAPSRTRAAAHDDALPRDVEALRHELAQRLDRLRAGRDPAGASL